MAPSPSELPAATSEPKVKGERIAKRMARAGLCSRREAERWIAAGRVKLDGVRLTSPAVDVRPNARITVDGRPLRSAEPTRLWRYHKPRGLICAERDPQGRPSVFDAMPDTMPRVISVGRLDFSSEGLLLLTNDGEVARRLELPSTGWLRRYRVRAFGRADEDALADLAKGVTIDGVAYGPVLASLERQKGDNAWISIGLREGKNREVRRLMEHLGLTVNRLIRTAFGPFQLGNLAAEAVAEVPAKVLAEQLGDGAPATLTLKKSPRPDKRRKR